MDSAQTNVAGAALVASSFFEMEEESRDTLDRKSFDSKLAGVAIFPRDKLQQSKLHSLATYLGHVSPVSIFS